MASKQFGLDGPNNDNATDNASDAHEVLRDLDNARATFGRKLATPWWYKLVAALLMAVLFAGAGMPYESVGLGSISIGLFLAALAAFAGPLLLRELLKRSTGASLDRYHDGWSLPSLTLIGLFLICLALRSFANLDLAPLIGAAVAAAFTFAWEKRTDLRLGRGEFPARTASPS